MRLGADAVGYTLYVGSPAQDAVHFAARTASELGADVVKVNFPHPQKKTDVPSAYAADFSSQVAIDGCCPGGQPHDGAATSNHRVLNRQLNGYTISVR